MTIKKIVYLSLTALLLASCGKEIKEYVLKVQLNKLTMDTMYDTELVGDVLFDAEELNVDSLKKRSRELFLQGIDAYKNKKKPEQAIQLFKSSIMYFPDAKTYYELGNALMEFQTSEALLTEAIKAYDVAEELKLQPLYMVYYKKACANHLLMTAPALEVDDNESRQSRYGYRVLNNLRSSFNNGFYDTTILIKDNRINAFLQTPEYKALLLELKLKNPEKTENNLFALFKGAFPPATPDFEITREHTSMDTYDESISYDFAAFVPEMQNTEFGREVSNDFFYVATIKETPSYTALVYTSVSFWGDSDMQPALTTLVTYDKTGTIIDRKLISCQCSAEKIKTAKINDNTVYVEDYKRIWEQPIDKVPFDENAVKQYDLLSKATYIIADNGTIALSDTPAGYSDSAMVTQQPKNNPR